MANNYVFVKVETDEGIIGWGEATMGAVSVTGVIEELGEMLVGRDPFRIEEAWQLLYNFSHNLRGGRAAHGGDQRDRYCFVGHQGQGVECSGVRASGRCDA